MLTRQQHAHAQNLRCKHCGQTFSTLGGHVGHLESGGCVIRQNLTEGVRLKTAQKEQMTAARNHLGSRAGNGMNAMAPEPMPAVRNYAVNKETLLHDTVKPNSLSTVNFSPGWGSGDGWGTSQYETFSVAAQPATSATSNTPTFDADDLISFDMPSRILNADWNASAPTQPAKDPFPPLTSYKNPQGPNLIDLPNTLKTPWTAAPGNLVKGPIVRPKPPQPPQTNPIDTQPLEKAFSAMVLIDAPSARATPSTPEGNSTISPFDPDNPTFLANTFYNQLLHQYRCPHPGCRKTCTALSPFLAHLRSAAHKNERLQCHGCLRYFDSATALTQHATAQGIRCRVRETDEYDGEVDRFTAGLARTDGKFDDNTIKYATSREAGPQKTAQDLVDAHRVRIVEKGKKQERYWHENRANW